MIFAFLAILWFSNEKKSSVADNISFASGSAEPKNPNCDVSSDSASVPDTLIGYLENLGTFLNFLRGLFTKTSSATLIDKTKGARATIRNFGSSAPVQQQIPKHGGSMQI
jgi:hypothetical protein